MNRIIGTCSICGGPVCVPTLWYGVNPPSPTCKKCGAVQRKSYGPVIDMDPPKKPSRWHGDRHTQKRRRIDEGIMRSNGGILGRIT